jgi:hypothetical protein
VWARFQYPVLGPVGGERPMRATILKHKKRKRRRGAQKKSKLSFANGLIRQVFVLVKVLYRTTEHLNSNFPSGICTLMSSVRCLFV